MCVYVCVCVCVCVCPCQYMIVCGTHGQTVIVCVQCKHVHAHMEKSLYNRDQGGDSNHYTIVIKVAIQIHIRICDKRHVWSKNQSGCLAILCHNPQT